MIIGEFKKGFFESILQFLWGQWDLLGVYGVIDGQEDTLIDPEALLLATLDIGRHDPRLFDEVLDWLVKNGAWINVRRLRNLIKEFPDFPKPVLAAACGVIEDYGEPNKWKLLDKHLGKHSPKETKPLFYFCNGRKIPIGRHENELFLKYGLSRGKLELRGMSRDVPMEPVSNLIFRLRSIFGITSRAEIFAYLLSHDEGHPSCIARDIYFSQKSVQDALVEMGQSGLFDIRMVGREKRYRLKRPEQWRKTLGLHKGRKPVWVNWPVVFRVIIKVWRTISEPGLEEESPYIIFSQLKSLMKDVRADLDNSGYLFDLSNASAYRSESFLDAFISDINIIVKWLTGNDIVYPKA